jgi:hypothetical protein
MANVSVVYQSRKGHTKVSGEAVLTQSICTNFDKSTSRNGLRPTAWAALPHQRPGI